MHDFLQQGAALASETEGDQQAKLRSFGDALYAPCLLHDHEIVEFLRKRNSDEDVMWMTAIVEELCPSLQPTKRRGSAKLGGRHYINAFRDIKTRYERLKKDEESDHSAAAEAEAAAAAAVQQQTEVSVAAQPDTSREGWQKAAWGSYTVPELKAALKSNGLGQSGKKVCLRRAPLPAPPARGPFACAARARDHRTLANRITLIPPEWSTRHRARRMRWSLDSSSTTYSSPALRPRRRHLEPWATTYRAAAQEQQQLQLMHDLRRSSSC